MYSISKNSIPQMVWLEAWVLMDDLDIVETGSCCLSLSHVKWYSWVYTIIHFILVSCFVWSMIPTHYMLLRTEPYLYFSLFSFCGVQRVYQWLRIALSSSKYRHIRFKDELFIRAWVGFSRSLHDVLSFRTQITLFSFILVSLIILDLVIGD